MDYLSETKNKKIEKSLYSILQVKREIGPKIEITKVLFI